MKNYYSVVVLTYDMPVTSVAFDDKAEAIRVAQTLNITRTAENVSIIVFECDNENFYQMEEIDTYGHKEKFLMATYKEAAYRAIAIKFWNKEIIQELKTK